LWRGMARRQGVFDGGGRFFVGVGKNFSHIGAP
jgi:hypothetical protein